MRGVAARLLAALAVVALGWALASWLAGGLRFRVAGIDVSSSGVWRPILAGLVALAASVWLTGPRESVAAFRRLPQRLTPARGAALLALAAVVTSLAGNTWTASGPDSFAYLSQAAQWRTGALDLPVPLAARAPWPGATTTFVPFGYREAAGGAPAIVPITAPGVPLAMAGLQTLFGHCAAFLVTPLAGGALVLLTFGIGARVRSPAAGLIASSLVATSPAVLFMLMWPMTDIPAAACTALVMWLLLRRSTPAGFFGGLAASLGLLTRLNFVVIVAGVGAWLVIDALLWSARDRRRLRLVAFALGLLPGVLFLAWLNARWYGSALASGYGTVEQLFSPARVLTNVVQYGRWMLETSPLALGGLAALVVPFARIWSGLDGRRAWALFAIVVAAACSVYLVYEPFTEWWYLRFLLPAWPALCVAGAIALDALRARGRLAAGAVTAAVVAAGIFGVYVAHARGVFAIGPTERRYVTIAHLVDRMTEPSAVILTIEHSGTIRYYAGRQTLRFDLLDGAWLDRAVEWLTAEGRPAYILVEDWEQPHFESRFRGANRNADLSYAPVLAWQSARMPGWVWLYDPRKRDAVTFSPGREVERAQPHCAPPKDPLPK